MKEKFSLKDELFNPKKVNLIACEIEQVYSSFPKELFEKEVVEKFPKLELKERIDHIRDTLTKHLPDDFKKATTILLKALPPELDNEKQDDDFGDFIYAPYAEFVALHGCTKEHIDFSLDALCQITKRFSVEFAIRFFINNFPKETLKSLKVCSLSDNYHQRRLASEGIRPKLPWGKKVDIDYRVGLELLENLYFDKTRFVTRSVANHLNDISKLDASLVLETLKRWEKSSKQDKKEMDFIISHSLRTLVKNGDKDTMIFLGFPIEPAIKVKNFKLLKEEVLMGESLEFDFEIKADKDVGLIVDYILHFCTKSNALSAKVHKIKKLHMKIGETKKIKKSHHFKKNMSTRKLYVGLHKVELQINGKIYESVEFQLNEL